MRTGRWFSRRQQPAATGHSEWTERLVRDKSELDFHEHVPPARGHPDGPTVLSIVVLLTLALGLLGAALASAGDSDAPSSPTSRSDNLTVTPPSLGTNGSAAGDRRALESCRALSALQRGVLDAARPAMRQWEVHIGAMNQLVAGKITLAQARAFWDSTRVQAARRVQAFEAADRLFRSSTGSLCPEAAAPPRDATGALQGCLDAVVAGDATVKAARTTMVTWRGHVRDMEHLRMGMLSPKMAQQMWQQTWKQGNSELRTYRRDDARAERLSCAP